MKLYYWLRDWQLPGQQHKGASKVEIPTDAAGLCAWLNERNVPINLPLNPPPERPIPVSCIDQAHIAPDPKPAPAPAAPQPSSFEATAIEDFVLTPEGSRHHPADRRHRSRLTPTTKKEREYAC